MRSDEAIKTDIYRYLKDSALTSEVTGVLKKTKRPHKSRNEDIVISILSNEGVQSQEATVNVNIYVQDYDIDGEYEENTQRLDVLCQVAWTTLESFHTDDYAAFIIGQRIYATDSGEHIINNRISYKTIND